MSGYDVAQPDIPDRKDRTPTSAHGGHGTGSPVTISRVAEAAGVSRATVSRVMNGSASVRPELIERVHTAVADLGYEPSAVAQSLARGRTSIVAIVVPDLGNPMFQAVLGGLTSAASDDDYRVLVADSREIVDEESLLAVGARRRCDGIVLCAPRLPAADLNALVPRLAPTVLVNRQIEDLPVPMVSVDQAAGIRKLADHLAGLGHRRIVYLSGPPTSAANRERWDALRVNAQGRFELVELACGAKFEHGHAAARSVVADSATAVVAYNDLVAFGALSGLHELGVNVPGDLSLAGFDDIPFARYTSPPLTTMSLPQEELGRMAWERLAALMHRQSPGADVCFTPRLEVRASTGPAPST